MKYDIILAGVGGQGVLSLAAVIAAAAMEEGLQVRQSEVHGMAQRGGAVVSHLRLSDRRIEGDLIPKGGAGMILSMEPLEGLRYLDFLSSGGKLVTSSDPVVNIPDYPEMEELLSVIRKNTEGIVVPSESMAREAGSVKATNMVMIGAAASFLPLRKETLEAAITGLFERKGADVVETNKKAFALGFESGKQAG